MASLELGIVTKNMRVGTEILPRVESYYKESWRLRCFEFIIFCVLPLKDYGPFNGLCPYASMKLQREKYVNACSLYKL